MAAAATEADIPPLLTEPKNERDRNIVVDEVTVDSISKLVQIHANEPLTFEGDNFLITPSVVEVQKLDQVAVDDQRLELVCPDKESNNIEDETGQPEKKIDVSTDNESSSSLISDIRDEGDDSLKKVELFENDQKSSKNETEEEVRIEKSIESLHDVAPNSVHDNNKATGSSEDQTVDDYTPKEDVATCVVNHEKELEGENSRKEAELVETEKCTEKVPTEASGEEKVPTDNVREISTDITKKEIGEEKVPTEDAREISTDITKKEIDEVATKPIVDHEQTENTIEDEKAESVEEQKCTEKETEISSAEALTEEEVQTTKSDATKDQITEVSAAASIENAKDESNSTPADIIKNEKYTVREIEVPSTDASCETETPTANLQEMTSEATNEEVPNSVEENAEDVVTDTPHPEIRDTPQVAEDDETKISACKVTENEVVNTVESFEKKECTEKTTDIAEAEKGSSEKDIQGADSLSDETKEGIDEVIDVSTKDVPANEEVSTSKVIEAEQPTSTFEDESSLKAAVVEKENCTEKNVEIFSREVSSEKEAESIESEKTKEVTTEVDQEKKDTSAVEEDRTEKAEKEVSSCEASADHEPTNSFEAKIEDEKPTEAELVENKKCIEGEMSSSEVLTSKDIPAANPQEISTDATKEADDSQKQLHEEVPTFNAKDHESENTLDAKLEDKNSLKSEFVENEECTEKEIEVLSLEPSSEKEIPTTNLQEISRAKTEEEIYEAAETKDITADVLDQEKEDTSLVADDRLQKPSQGEIIASNAIDQETANTLEDESSLKPEVVEKEECPEKEMETSSTELSSETMGNDKTEEKIAEVKEDDVKAEIEEESSLKEESVETEKCIDKEMEKSSSTTSTEKEIQTEHLEEITSGSTKEEVGEAASITEESVKDVATDDVKNENADTTQADDSQKPYHEEVPTSDANDHDSENTLDAKFEEENSLKSETDENVKGTVKEMEVVAAEVSSEKQIPTTNLQEISTKKEEEIYEAAETKDITADVLDQENEDTSLVADDRLQKPSQGEIIASKATDQETANTLEDESSLKVESVEKEECPEKETETSSTELSSEKEIQTTGSDKTEEKIAEVADIKEDGTEAKIAAESTLKEENVENEKCIDKDMEISSSTTSTEKEVQTEQLEEITSGSTKEERDEVASTTEEYDKDVATDDVNKENADTMQADESPKPSHKEVTTSDANNHDSENTVDAKFEDESSLKSEFVENEECTEKEMEVLPSEPSSEKEIPTTNLQEISSTKTEEEIYEAGETKDITAEDHLQKPAQETTNTLEDESSSKVELVEKEECPEKETETSLTEVSSEKEIETSESEKTKETITEVADVKEDGAEAKVEEESSLKEEIVENEKCIDKDMEISSTTSTDREIQMERLQKFSSGTTEEASDKTEISENEECTETTAEILPKADSSDEVHKTDSHEISSEKPKEETGKVADTEEESTEDLLAEEGSQKPSEKEVLTSVVQDRELTITRDAQQDNESSVNAECIENDKCTIEETDKPSTEVSSEKETETADPQEASSDKTKEDIDELADLKEESIKDAAVTENFQDESSIKPELVENEKSTEKPLVEDETTVDSVYAADDEIKEVKTDIPNENAKETETLTRETMESTLVTEGDQTDTSEEKSTEANVEDDKGITSSEKDNEQTPALEDDSKKPSLEEASVENTDDDKSTVVQDDKYAEENTTEHALSIEEKAVECTMEKKEVSIESSQEVNPLEEQIVSTNTETPDVHIQGHKVDETTYASDPKAEAPEEKDVAATVTQENQVKALETSKEPETKSTEDQIITSSLQEISVVKMNEENSDITSMNKETLDKQEVKLEDKETITAEFSERSIDESLVTKELQVAVKDDAECVSNKESEISPSLQEETAETNHEKITYDNKEDEKTNKMEHTVETPVSENIPAIDDEKSATVPGAEHVEHDLSTHEKDTEFTSGKDEVSIESLQEAGEDIKAVDSVEETDVSHLEEQDKATNTQEITSVIKEDKEVDALDLNAEKPENKDVATTVTYKDTEENLPSESDERQYTHLEKVIENSSDVKTLTQNTDESTLVKEELRVDTELSTPCQEPELEAKSPEVNIVTTDLQEYPIAKIEEGASNTASTPKEALDEQEIKYEDKDMIPTKSNESSTDVALATEESQVEEIKLAAPCQEAEVKSAEEQLVTSDLQEIPTAKIEEEASDTKPITREALDEQETKFEDKDRSTDEALAVEEESIESLQVSVKDVAAYDAGEEESEKSSSVQDEIPKANHENVIDDNKDGGETEEMETTIEAPDIKDVTTIPHEDMTAVKEESEAQSMDSLQEREASPVTEQTSDTDSLNASCATTEEKILSDETKDVQESTAAATLVANDSSLGMESTIDDKQMNEGEIEDTEHHHLGSCKEEIMEEKQVEEAIQETHENTDNLNEAENVPRVSEGDSGENARETQHNLPVTELLVKSLETDQEEVNEVKEITKEAEKESKVSEEVVQEPEEILLVHADNSLNQKGVAPGTEETATIVHAERSNEEDDAQYQETKTEDSKEEAIIESSPGQDAKPKEVIMEEICEDKENKKAETIVHADRSYGEEEAQHQETKIEDSREEATIESSPEDDVKPKEIIMEDIREVKENEKTETIEHAEKSHGEEDDAQHQESKAEDSRKEAIIESSPEYDVKPKEVIMEELCEVKENEKAEVLEHAERTSGEEDAQHQETKVEDSREEEITESFPEHNAKSEEIIAKEICEFKENEKVVTVVHAERSYGEEDAQHQETKAEDSREEPMIESSGEHDVKSREIIMEDTSEVKENENETEKVFNVLEATVEKEKDKTIEEVTTIAETEDPETYESSADKSSVQKELDASIKEHVKVEDALRIDPVHTETNIEKPIKTEGYTECDAEQQETDEKEICQVQKTADETTKEPKPIEGDFIQEPEEDTKTDKSFDESPYEVNQQEINEKEISEVKPFSDELSKESEENVHADVTESLQQKEPEKCIEQVSEISKEDSEHKMRELEEKFTTNVIRSLPQNEHDVNADENAAILDTKEVCHESVDVHTEARGAEDLEVKGETENHPVESETKGASSDFEKVDGKVVQALEETHRGIEMVTTTLDTSKTGFEESKSNLVTVADKDVEHAITATALDTEILDKSVTCDPIPTQTVTKAIEHTEDKNKNSDTILEEASQKPDQKDNIHTTNELEVKEEESPLVTETKGEDGDKNTKDTEKPSLSALFQSSTREVVPTADDQVATKDRQLHAEQNDDDPAKSHEEKVSDEESNEKQSSDLVAYEPPVMVDAVADTEVKNAHKKSHNILSGVGSKVKHSISKVKKAITGKSSSHPKQTSPK